MNERVVSEDMAMRDDAVEMRDDAVDDAIARATKEAIVQLPEIGKNEICDVS